MAATAVNESTADRMQAPREAAKALNVLRDFLVERGLMDLQLMDGTESAGCALVDIEQAIKDDLYAAMMDES